jgi:hypothetical protein
VRFKKRHSAVASGSAGCDFLFTRAKSGVCSGRTAARGPRQLGHRLSRDIHRRPIQVLENLQSPETQAWAAGQSAHTRRLLDSLPGRAPLLERLAQIDKGLPGQIVSLSMSTAGRWFTGTQS